MVESINSAIPGSILSCVLSMGIIGFNLRGPRFTSYMYIVHDTDTMEWIGHVTRASVHVLNPCDMMQLFKLTICQFCCFRDYHATILGANLLYYVHSKTVHDL